MNRPIAVDGEGQESLIHEQREIFLRGVEYRIHREQSHDGENQHDARADAHSGALESSRDPRERGSFKRPGDGDAESGELNRHGEREKRQRHRDGE